MLRVPAAYPFGIIDFAPPSIFPLTHIRLFHCGEVGTCVWVTFNPKDLYDQCRNAGIE